MNLLLAAFELTGDHRILGGFLAVALVSYLMEVVASWRGVTYMMNWKNVINALVAGILFLIWITWSQEVNFANTSHDPGGRGTEFRMMLLLLIAISVVLPVWLTVSSLSFTLFDRRSSGPVVFVGRLLSIVGFAVMMVFATKSVQTLLQGVKISFYS